MIHSTPPDPSPPLTFTGLSGMLRTIPRRRPDRCFRFRAETAEESNVKLPARREGPPGREVFGLYNARSMRNEP